MKNPKFSAYFIIFGLWGLVLADWFLGTGNLFGIELEPKTNHSALQYIFMDGAFFGMIMGLLSPFAFFNSFWFFIPINFAILGLAYASLVNGSHRLGFLLYLHSGLLLMAAAQAAPSAGTAGLHLNPFAAVAFVFVAPIAPFALILVGVYSGVLSFLKSLMGRQRSV